MPVNPSLIGAGASLLGNVISGVSQGSLNRRTREWNAAMYRLQRQHSLMDWHRENEYNHPIQQMARLKAAGLNPNLVYGNGADAQASSIRGANPDSWRPQAAQYDFSNIGSMVMLNEQAKLMREQADSMRQDQMLKAAQTLATLTGEKKTAQEVVLGNRLMDTTVQAAEASLQKTLTETTSIGDANRRANQVQGYTIQQMAENILKTRADRAHTNADRLRIYAQIENIKRDSRLKELDIQLKEKGIQPHDNVLFRVLAQMLAEGRLKMPTINSMIDGLRRHNPFSNNRPGKPGIPGIFSFKNPFIKN